jgi:hypothetical protein
MKSKVILSDFDHPLIVNKANELTDHLVGLKEKIEAIFLFVRDEIKFGFPSKWDIIKASEVLDYGMGYCNPKATLFLALARAVNIPTRIHCGLIDNELLTGISPTRFQKALPRAGSHSWIELHLDGQWKSIDSYINDEQFYKNALILLHESGQKNGYLISIAKGESSCEFNFGEKGFVQMWALIEDHGSWNDFSEYVSSGRYLTPNEEFQEMYPIFAKLCNRAIERIRNR